MSEIALVRVVPPTFARERLLQLVVDAVSSTHSKRAYGQGLADFFSWYDTQGGEDGFCRATVQRYRSHLEAAGLAPATINIRLAAIRKLASEGMEQGQLAPDVGQGIVRMKGVKSAGRRLGNWLTKKQTETLLQLPTGNTNRDKRDRALLCLFVGCGLRRTELAALTVEHVQQRDGRWVLVDLIGKGKRVRAVPMPAWSKAALDVWTEAAGLTAGRLFRPVNKCDRIEGQSITPQAAYGIVAGYSRQLGCPCTPHDLRRTFAQLAHKGQSPLEQIQLSLGHASIQTTERYLGVRQDLQDAPCDHLGLRVK